MYRLLFTLFLIGCTDYQLKNFDESPPGADPENPDSDGTGNSDTDSTEEEEDQDTIDEDDDCTDEMVGFDIGEFSTLQDAVSYSIAGWTHDAVVLSFDDSQLEADQTWRVSAVELLIMIPVERFNLFEDGQEIHIEVFDSNNPNSGQRYTKTMQVYKDDLSWQDYTLPADAYHASLYLEFQQKGAWLRFDMLDVIPETGMTSTDFIAGVWWEPPGMVKVGYSNFNQDCSKNWSDYNDGAGWLLNSTNPDFFGCSWPMLRVHIETRTPGDCK